MESAGPSGGRTVTDTPAGGGIPKPHIDALVDKLRIRGGQPLRGRVRAGGAKNAALPELCAVLLTDEPVVLRNVPGVKDVTTIGHLLRHLGVEIEESGDRIVARCSELAGCEAPYDLVKTMRASFLVLGPLLARAGRARVSLPGGCAIGARPVDQHLAALTRMGAELDVVHGYVEGRADGLRGAEIVFDQPTVGGTENTLMAATLARGTTVLRNVAREPEVEDLATLLRAMGADIEGAGTDEIVVRGVEALHGADHPVIPDRIEAGTYLLAGALLGDPLEIVGCVPRHLGAVLEKLAESEITVDVAADSMTVRAGKPARGVDLRTDPYPGFPTDMQAQFTVLMTQAEGTSTVSETIFENRFMHVPELNRMGADIAIQGNTVTVRGPRRLSGARVMATDLRASACLVLAGLVAEGETVLDRLYHLDRGYEALVDKLADVGADVERFRERRDT